MPAGEAAERDQPDQGGDDPHTDAPEAGEQDSDDAVEPGPTRTNRKAKPGPTDRGTALVSA